MTGTQDLIARLWARFQPLAAERAALIAGYLDGDGAEPAVHAAARQAAHDMVGSLGSYGRPQGSVLAARLEHLLGDRPSAMDAAARSEARTLVAALAEEVGP